MSYTVAGMNKWLHHHGFSYKKPKGVPRKLKPEEQQAFIEYYSEVLKFNDAPVLFMDAVHPTQSTKLSYGWLRKGQDKLIETTGSRTRLNIIGALALKDIGVIRSRFPISYDGEDEKTCKCSNIEKC